MLTPRYVKAMNTTGDGKAPAINHQATFTSSNSEYAIDGTYFQGSYFLFRNPCRALRQFWGLITPEMSFRLIEPSQTSSADTEFRNSDLHDILHAYYKVARKRFVDAVCMQASDYFLVNGQDAPIKVFSPKFVSELTDEQLETIAGEEMGAKRKRDDLSRKIENLEAGRKIAVS